MQSSVENSKKKARYYNTPGIASTFTDKYGRYVEISDCDKILKRAIKKYGNLRQFGLKLNCHISQVYRWFYAENRMTKEWYQKIEKLLAQ